MALLEIKNLTVKFKTAGGLFTAVNRISANIEAGEVVAIVGESGSGKSVAMLATMGLLPWTAQVTADRLVFDGIDLLTISHKKRRKIIGKEISMIFQEPMTSLNPCFTVGFQLAESLKTHTDLSRKARKKRAIELLDWVGIPEPQKRLSAFPHQLSGGMNQRVMIAIAIACNPRLLIADEPTTALDVTIQAQVLDLIRKLRDEHGMAVMLITHNMGIVAEMADIVTVMYAGTAVEEAPTLELFEEPLHPYTRGLIASIPVMGKLKDRLDVIPGTVPNLIDMPVGCRFAPRCKARVEHQLTRCEIEEPHMIPAKPNHFVRCWLYEDAEGAEA